MMELKEISDSFNRSLYHSFSLKKILFTGGALIVAGLFFVFFQSLTFFANSWMRFSLGLVPFFIGIAILLSAGIILIRLYHDEIKGEKHRFREVVGSSLDLLVSSIYFVLPLIAGFIAIWLIEGLFVLLGALPAVGPFFAAILSFMPYLLTLAAILLLLFGFVALFYVTPVLALRGLDRPYLQTTLLTRIKKDPFYHLILLGAGYIPVYMFYYVLMAAKNITSMIMAFSANESFLIVAWFFLMLPISVLFSPAFIFFFNFAAESHILLKKERGE